MPKFQLNVYSKDSEDLGCLLLNSCLAVVNGFVKQKKSSGIVR